MNPRLLLMSLILATCHQAVAKLPTAPVQISNGYVSGNVYRDMADTAKHAYVMGVVDGILLSPILGAESKDVQPVSDCIKGMRSDQLQAIVDAFLQAHPERWDESMHTIAYGALFGACKARGKPLR
jgi:hypothetical protein